MNVHEQRRQGATLQEYSEVRLIGLSQAQPPRKGLIPNGSKEAPPLPAHTLRECWTDRGDEIAPLRCIVTKGGALSRQSAVFGWFSGS